MIAPEEKAKLAEAYFREGYNCAQAVVAAFCEECGLTASQAAKISSSFGGGMGRMREVCGSVSGMFMVIGAVLGYDDPSQKAAKGEHYALVRKMASEFSEKNGSIVCRELLGGSAEKGGAPSERTEAFYQKRPCVEYVKDCARITAETLNACMQAD